MKERWHLFNQIRIVRVGEVFMVQKKFMFTWRFMPDANHYIQYTSLRWKHEYLIREKEFNEARRKAVELKAFFHPRTEVEDCGTV